MSEFKYVYVVMYQVERDRGGYHISEIDRVFETEESAAKYMESCEEENTFLYKKRLYK